MRCSPSGTETAALAGRRNPLLFQARVARQRVPLPGCLDVATGGILTFPDCPSCYRLPLQFLRL